MSEVLYHQRNKLEKGTRTNQYASLQKPLPHCGESDFYQNHCWHPYESFISLFNWIRRKQLVCLLV